jgi:hypothetical protein
LHALLSRGLRSAAEHAEHIFRHLTIERVRKWQIFGIVVAVIARKPPFAVKALDFDIPLVVHASEIWNLLVVDGLVRIIAEIVRRGRKRAEAGTGISCTQFVWIARILRSVPRRRRRETGHLHVCLVFGRRLMVMVMMIMLAGFLPLQIVLCHQLMHPSCLLFRGQSEQLNLLQLLTQHRHAIILRENPISSGGHGE